MEGLTSNAGVEVIATRGGAALAHKFTQLHQTEVSRAVNRSVARNAKPITGALDRTGLYRAPNAQGIDTILPTNDADPTGYRRPERLSAGRPGHGLEAGDDGSGRHSSSVDDLRYANPSRRGAV
jgi:hypothetical protein